MYGMTRAARTRHAVDLLLRCFALRFAIRAPTATAESTARTAARATPLRCRLANHRWVTQSTTDGARFRRCARCGTDKYDGSAGPMDGFMAANPYGSGF
jgi:hypothetical protein